MEPNDKARQLRRTAKLLIYVQQQLGQGTPRWVQKTAANICASDERVVSKLYNTVRNMSPSDMERIAYNAHSVQARDLADWWEEHQKADRAREAEKAAAQEKERQRAAGLAKLTPDEIEALGIKK
jgi:hypothetical protein